ncbi:uncharacterized protein HMPREF1541_09652, partial [Cyphellophora europaea CBS 101466]
MATWLVKGSAKLRYTCRIIYNLRYNTTGSALEQNKLLIFCNFPNNCWIYAILWNILSIEYTEIYASITGAEKEAIIQRFNNCEDKARVLISTFKVLGVSVNMQNTCHNVIMNGLLENMASLNQGKGR